MEKDLTTVFDPEQREQRIEGHRREFNVPLLTATEIDDGAMAIATSVFDALNAGYDKVAGHSHGAAMFLLALRLIAVNTQVTHDTILQTTPCQRPKYRARMN